MLERQGEAEVSLFAAAASQKNGRLSGSDVGVDSQAAIAEPATSKQRRRSGQMATDAAWESLQHLEIIDTIALKHRRRWNSRAKLPPLGVQKRSGRETAKVWIFFKASQFGLRIIRVPLDLIISWIVCMHVNTATASEMKCLSPCRSRGSRIITKLWSVKERL